MELQADKINKTYKGRKVVKVVSLTLKKGEIVGLLGPNGAGKTTSFYMIVGLIKPDTGNVFLHQNNITKVPMYKRSKMGIGYLPQEVSVFRKLSAEDNIKAILEMSSLSKKEQKINILLELIIERKILDKNGILMLHRNKKTLDKFPEKLKIFSERIYGLSKIYFIKL